MSSIGFNNRNQYRSGHCGIGCPEDSHRRCSGNNGKSGDGLKPCACRFIRADGTRCHEASKTINESDPIVSIHVLPDLLQGTAEWFDQRRGIVTASVVGKLLTPTLKVADNDTSRGLTTTLAAERITGWTEETPMTSDMWRGVESEPFAREKYAEHYAPVTEIGFMLREEDGWRLGYSPDGLVGDDGLIEIKAPRAKTHVRTILANEVPAHYMAQCQAGLLVSGRKWIDFVSFVGGMPLYVKRVLPDEKWFDAITDACIAFEANAAQIVADYEKRVADMPKTERIDFDLKVA